MSKHYIFDWLETRKKRGSQTVSNSGYIDFLFSKCIHSEIGDDTKKSVSVAPLFGYKKCNQKIGQWRHFLLILSPNLETHYVPYPKVTFLLRLEVYRCKLYVIIICVKLNKDWHVIYCS